MWSRDYAVQRYSLADGRALGRFENDAFPTSLAVQGGRLLVGLDDGAVVEFDIATGKRLNILGTFGTDVVDIVPVTDDLMWISTTGRVLSLFDGSSTAVLHRQTLAAFGVHVVAASPLALAVGGEGGSLSLLTLDAAVAAPERIQDELDCRVPFALDGGVLRPRDVDLAACSRLAQ